MKMPIVKTNSNKMNSTNSYTTWDPFDWLYPSFSHFGFSTAGSTINSFFDYQYEDDHLIVSCDVPGVKLEDVSLETEGNLLKVSTHRKGRYDQKQTQSVIISKEYNMESAEATLEYGVLSIKFKKSPSAKAKKIEIKEKR